MPYNGGLVSYSDRAYNGVLRCTRQRRALCGGSWVVPYSGGASDLHRAVPYRGGARDIHRALPYSGGASDLRRAWCPTVAGQCPTAVGLVTYTWTDP